MGGGLVGGLVDGSVFGRSVDRSVGSVLVGGLVGEVSSFSCSFLSGLLALIRFRGSATGHILVAVRALVVAAGGRRAVWRGPAPAGWGAATALATQLVVVAVRLVGSHCARLMSCR